MTKKRTISYRPEKETDRRIRAFAAELGLSDSGAVNALVLRALRAIEYEKDMLAAPGQRNARTQTFKNIPMIGGDR